MSGAPAASIPEDVIRERVLAVLRRIAPEADPKTIDPAADLRQELDVDSMDFLNFLVGIHAALGIEVPEADASRLRTLDDIVRYVTARSASSVPPAPPGPGTSSS